MRKQGKIKYRQKPRVRIVLSTFGSLPQARRLAEGLIRCRFAACCNILPGLSSFYIWKGKQEASKEVLLLVKTTERRLLETLTYLKQKHPYDLPELIVLPVLGAEAGYLQWILKNTRKGT